VKIFSNIIIAVMMLVPKVASAQNNDSKILLADTTSVKAGDQLTKDDSLKLMRPDTTAIRKKQGRNWATWKPNPQRALWLALVLPGAGQIYNRKFWKLPIIYGGIVGCAYAMTWNNQMYHDYAQAYMDLMDDDPQTDSYNQFMHLGGQITSDNISTYQTLFQKRKDRYRRWRDLSFFVMVGVYALSVIDAYVDASLSEFDISQDLSLRIEPAVINTNAGYTNRMSLKNSGVGVHCALNF
jgi:hypothetical protein